MKIKIIAMIATLAAGGIATSHADSHLPEAASRQAMQPASRANVDRDYVFQQMAPDARARLTIIAPQAIVPSAPRAANDFNWLAGGGG